MTSSTTCHKVCQLFAPSIVAASVRLAGIALTCCRSRSSGTAQPEWKPNTVLRGLEHLWLEQAAGVRPPAPR
jgi:hypothetical protein